ncbi:ABC transporter permease [Streptomyces sp. LX-29]|uniref:ABC transporter permease subunit n=1 Tax=Streptomyces sp. LX-29 TaxID=2900152 RepID=UPI00240E85DB|nr:ABC transporter permease subunit [Streptomyces sp. LX-29]WFB11564.1 ABC transporter permease [Streptomyces sp. LX-29]
MPQGGPQAMGQGAAPMGGYVSAIPIRRAHLGDALASEWTKIKSVRSTMWTLGVMILLVVGVDFATAAVVADSEANLEGESPLGIGFVGVLLGLLCVITLGVLVIASEYGTGMIRTTLTACPSRSRVLTAKAIVFFLVAFSITTATAFLAALINDSMLGSMEGAGESTGEDWFKATVGIGLYVAMLGLLALAVGALIRHSAGAITIMIGVVLLPLVLAIFMQGEGLTDLRDAMLEYSIPNQLGVMYANTVSDTGPSGWDPLWIITGVTAAVMACAYALLNKRDV